MSQYLAIKRINYGSKKRRFEQKTVFFCLKRLFSPHFLQSIDSWPQEDAAPKISVSELAESLSENQLCPITRDRNRFSSSGSGAQSAQPVFPLSSPNTEERKARQG